MIEKVHKEDVATVVAGFHTAGEHNNDGALRVKAEDECFPEGQCGANNDDEGEYLLEELV